MSQIRKATPHRLTGFHFIQGEAQGPVRPNSPGRGRGCPWHKAIKGLLLLWLLRRGHLGRAASLIIDRFLLLIDMIVADGIIHSATTPQKKTEQTKKSFYFL